MIMLMTAFMHVRPQGRVAEVGPSDTFLLDDGSGRLPIAAGGLPRDNPLPPLVVGDYVVVIGRLLPGDPNNPGPEALSVKATKVHCSTLPISSHHPVKLVPSCNTQPQAATVRLSQQAGIRRAFAA